MRRVALFGLLFLSGCSLFNIGGRRVEPVPAPPVAPPTAVPTETPPSPWSSDGVPFLRIEHFTGGLCGAPCSGSIEIAGRNVRLVLEQSAPGHGEVRGTLTAQGSRHVNALADRLSHANLKWVYRSGCGAPCDGSTVVLQFGEARLQTQFNADGRVPTVLDRVLLLQRSIEDDLRECRPSPLVRPTRDCSPIRG